MSWSLGGRTLESRLLLGTAAYASPEVMREAIMASGAEVVTVSLLREKQIGSASKNVFWEYVQRTGCHVLPNTAGCRTATEAINTAQMAREVFETAWIKLEVIGDDYTLQPHSFELLKAAEKLVALGFEVFPYCTEDLVVCQQLVAVGCKQLMPWAAPIGSGQGIIRPRALRLLRERFPNINLIVDAGIGSPAHAVQAMELGMDGVLLNSAVALAESPVKMAEAFKWAIKAGVLGYGSGIMPQRDFAQSTTPLLDTPFWHSTYDTESR
eukprot:TRINITY_DN20691_c0_g1_i1.p1 TRINITY_DN20691_c0_g1~~TRINITY_DN20691_c0_g1_i1.p1  ORF type:complete len:268 (+),score=-59.87 TRINITY_DN20691_c0_g1_i1:623-1426(+)